MFSSADSTKIAKFTWHYQMKSINDDYAKSDGRAQQLIGLTLKRIARIDDAKNFLENNRANT